MCLTSLTALLLWCCVAAAAGTVQKPSIVGWFSAVELCNSEECIGVQPLAFFFVQLKFKGRETASLYLS